MRWAAALLSVVLLLATPLAAAWPATMRAAPEDASLRDSILLAGALRAKGTDGTFGAPDVERLTFDAPVTVRYCPDQGGRMQPEAQCPGGQVTTGARLYVLAGGIAASAPRAALTLRSEATAAALGGPNLTLNGFAPGPGVYTGGATVVDVEGATLALRPLRSSASIEVRGDQGFTTYNGTDHTLYVSGFSTARLEATGAFLAAADLDVTLTRAGLVPAERGIAVDDLHALLTALQPAEKADRRTAIVGAFGPFQLVPALLDGALARRQNLTLGAAPQESFTFLRLQDARFSHDGENWSGAGNATYMVEGDLVLPEPGARVGFPVVVPIVLLAAATTGRVLTDRGHPTKSRRALAHAIRLVELALLALLAAATLAPLLGFSPLLDARELSLRSRVQLALLVVGIVVSAYVAIGFPSESIARSVLAWRARTRALLVPALVGLLATALFLLLAMPILLSFVARLVRL